MRAGYDFGHRARKCLAFHGSRAQRLATRPVRDKPAAGLVQHRRAAAGNALEGELPQLGGEPPVIAGWGVRTRRAEGLPPGCTQRASRGSLGRGRQ